MWKKPFKTGKQNLIKSSEKRKLKEKLLAAFPSLSQEALDSLLPNKEDIHEIKVTGSRTVIYSKNEEPLFFDLEGRGEPKNFFPTVYALWKLPPFLPTFDVHAPVFKYIAKGADLMLPGVVPPPGGQFEPFAERSKRVVQIVGTKTPLGVGITQCTDATIAENGMKGKALMMTHFYTDFLWRLGSKSHPKLGDLENDIDSDAEIDEEAAAEAEAAQQSTTENPSEESTASSPENILAPTSEPVAEITSQLDQTILSTTESEPVVTETDASDDIPVEIIDALVLATFLQAIKRRLKETDLPMLVSAFYSQVYLPCRPIGTNINFKRSSYKKFGTFLQQMEEKGLCHIDEPTPGVLRLLAINRGHDDFVAFRPLPVAATVEGAEKAAAMEAEENENEQIGPQIREAWQLPKNLYPVVPDHIQMSGRFEMSECTSMLWDYVTLHELADPSDPKKVVLDQILASVLFPKELHAAGAAPVIVEKKMLAQRFREKLIKVNEVTIDGITKVKKGELGKVSVIVEPRQGRKWMTRVLGLEKFGVDPKEVAKVCPKKFAASASVAKLPGKANIDLVEVLVQGKFGDEVVGLLEADFNIPTKYIELSGAGARPGKGR